MNTTTIQKGKFIIIRDSEYEIDDEVICKIFNQHGKSTIYIDDIISKNLNLV